MLTVSEKKQPLPPSSAPPLIVEAAGQRYAQTTEFRYLRGLVNNMATSPGEINCTIETAWACFRRYAREVFYPFLTQVRPGGGDGGTALWVYYVGPTE